jgi:hypothetical protein
MATLFQRIQNSLAKEGIQARTNLARTWIQTKAKNLNFSPNSLLKDRQNLTSTQIIGKMYFFLYDPKTKKTMNYYDKFPLVIPIELHRDGFLGLNLHYIHPKNRIQLLDKLSDTLNNNNYDENTKFKINYAYLSKASRIFEATPCIKKYLYTNINSKFLEIKSDEWDIASLLPAERFQKATKEKVFAESRKKF